MKKVTLYLSLLILCSLVFIGCASLQKDVIVSTDSFIQSEDIEYLENKFVHFDAKRILNGRINPESPEYKELDDYEKEITNTIKASGVNKILVSRLYALEGLVNLAQGKKQRAKTLYQKSLETSKGDSYTIILGSRLDEVKSLEDENVISGSSESVLLILEQGLLHYEKGEYTDCVAKLDSAFIELPEYYREAYNDIRQNAWVLRNNSSLTDDKNILTLLNKAQITVGEMILITQETTDLFTTLNGGKKFSETELFNRLKKAGYFEPCSAIEVETSNKNNDIKRNQIVIRSIAARFLWNLNFSGKSNTSLKTRNSNLYREKVGYSPVPDINLDSADFDAILGVVEQEIMSLTDGVNFEPEGIVSASDFNYWVKKIH